MSGQGSGAGRTVVLVASRGNSTALLVQQIEREGHRVLLQAEGTALRLAGVGNAAAAFLIELVAIQEARAVIRELRRRTSAPIIIIVPKANAVDRVTGLELGADDVLVKPFDVRELLARLQALMRRHELATHGSRSAKLHHWSFDRWQLDALSRRLRDPDGQAVELTGGEYRLLEIFLRHPGQVQSRQELLNKIYERDWSRADRSIDNLVVRLRRKLRDDPRRPHMIKTARGNGYVLSVPVRVARSTAP